MNFKNIVVVWGIVASFLVQEVVKAQTPEITADASRFVEMDLGHNGAARAIFLNFANHLDFETRSHFLDEVIPQMLKGAHEYQSLAPYKPEFLKLLDDHQMLAASMVADYQEYEKLILQHHVKVLFVEAAQENIDQRLAMIKEKGDRIEQSFIKFELHPDQAKTLMLLLFGKDYFFVFSHPQRMVDLRPLESRSLIERQGHSVIHYNKHAVALGSLDILPQFEAIVDRVNSSNSQMYFGAYQDFDQHLAKSEKLIDELVDSWGKFKKSKSEALYTHLVGSLHHMIELVTIRRLRDRHMAEVIFTTTYSAAIAAIGSNHFSGVLLHLRDLSAH